MPDGADTREVSRAALATGSAPVARDPSIARLSLATVPVLASTRAAVQELSGRVTLSNLRVATIAMADPGLALQLLREANVQAHERRELEVSTITHAVSLLGMEQTLDFVTRLRTVEDIRPRLRREGLLHAMARAAHAAGLAREWTAGRKEAAIETAVCATVLRHAAELAVWAGHPESHKLFARLAAKGGPEAETGLFGETLAALGARLAEDGHLPDALRGALDDTGALQPRLTPSILASAIANATARDWYAPATMQLMSLRAELAGIDPERGPALVQSATVRVARQSPFGAAMSAARYLLLAPGERFVAEEAEPPVAAEATTKTPAEPPKAARAAGTRPAAAPGTRTAAEPATPSAGKAPAPRPAGPTPPAPATAATPPVTRAQPGGETPATGPAPKADEEAFRESARLLVEVRRGRATVQKVLPRLVDGMREGLGFDRAVFALVNREKQCLQGRYTSGEPSAEKLEVDLSRANLIAQLMKAPQGLWLHAGTRERLMPYLPRTLRAYLGTRSFCAMSLFVQERPIGLLYADYEGDAVDERAYSRFKQVAVELAAALAPSRRPR